MNKKLMSVLSLSLVIFVACSDKWKQELPENTPQAFIDQEEKRVDDNLALLDKDSSDISANFEVGYGYQQLGEFKKAVEYYEKVLELSASNYPALNNLADIYEQVGEYDLASKHIKKLYELNETDQFVIEDVVRILLKNNEPASAQSALENFARKTKNTAGDYERKLISDLFESIQNYSSQHEQNQ